MKSSLDIIRRSLLLAVSLFIFTQTDVLTRSAHAEDVAPAVATTTNSVDATNNAEGDKAWKIVREYTHSPMPPKEWSTKEPTREEVEKFNLDILHKGIDAAKDFYTRFPNHPKAATAKQVEFEMLTIATEQFNDTNLAPRLAAVGKQRLTDPKVSEDEKFKMRTAPLNALMHDLPDSATELDKQMHELQKDFPNKPEVYKLMLMVLSRSEGARAEAWAKEILASAAPEDVKTQAKLELRAGVVEKLVDGLPATADELDKNVRALPKEFPGRPDIYNLMLFALQRSDAAHAEALAKDIQASDAPDEVKAKVKVVLRTGALEKLVAGLPGTLDQFLKGVHDFQKDYPENQSIYNVLMDAFGKSEGATAKAIGAELTAGAVPANLRAQITSTMKQMEFVGKPMNIRYTAVDGREVDMAKLTGKVVLVDFWATWCGPCMGEVPKVKATYDKLHDKGFEIVGISLDQSKEALVKVTKAKGMTWPQYFETDTTGNNKFAEQYQVMGIPSMWLVDKKGLLRTVNGRDGLEEQVTKLLAE